MRAVLDEGAPDDIIPPLRKVGANIDPFHPEWRGYANGALLGAIENAGYELLVTNDKNIGFQLNLRRLRIAIVSLPINRPDVLLIRIADVFDTLQSARLGQVILMGLDGRRLVRSADTEGKISLTELSRVAPFSS